MNIEQANRLVPGQLIYYPTTKWSKNDTMIEGTFQNIISRTQIEAKWVYNGYSYWMPIERVFCGEFPSKEAEEIFRALVKNGWTVAPKELMIERYGFEGSRAEEIIEKFLKEEPPPGLEIGGYCKYKHGGKNVYKILDLSDLEAVVKLAPTAGVYPFHITIKENLIPCDYPEGETK